MAGVTQEELDIAAAEAELAALAAEARPVAERAAAVKSARIPDTSMLAKAKAAFMGATYNAAPRIVELNSPDLFKKSQAQADEDLRNRQREFRQASRDNPGSDIAGAVLAPNPFSKLSLPGRVLAGGGMNALSAYLGEEPDNEQAQSEAGQLGFWTGVGATLVGEGILRGGGKVLKSASRGLKEFGRGRALNTLSPSKTDMGAILSSGRAEELADDLYSSGVIGPLSNTKNVAENLAPLVEKRGQRIGEVIGAVDSPSATLPTVTAQRIRDDAAENLLPYTVKRGAYARAVEEADAIEKQYGKGPMSLADSEKFLKSGYDDYAKKAQLAEARGAALPNEVEALDGVRRSIKQQNEAAFDARAAGTPWEGEFVKSKKAYGLAAEALNVADKTGGPKAANRFLSPSDYGFGIAAGQAYQPGGEFSEPVAETLLGMAAAVGHNQLRTRGAALMTHAGYKGSAVSRWLGETLASEGSKSAGAAALRRSLLENPEPGDQKLSNKGAEELRRYLLEHAEKPGSDGAKDHYVNGG